MHKKNPQNLELESQADKAYRLGKEATSLADNPYKTRRVIGLSNIFILAYNKYHNQLEKENENS
jgi:hypothetical protein